MTTIQTTIEVHGEELDVTVEARIDPGSLDYFCPSFGNWLPGDAPELQLQSVLGQSGEELLGLIDEGTMDELHDRLWEEWDRP